MPSTEDSVHENPLPNIHHECRARGFAFGDVNLRAPDKPERASPIFEGTFGGREEEAEETL